MVSLDARGVSIDGQYRTLLCSSLFYFRIPEGLWGDRMSKVKTAGYNSIDVYFPWNFHEIVRDRWDFDTGMRDVGAFLDLAARQRLYVVARPGPYICSEWDGGGLPAYLSADGLEIRQSSAGYLERVREWYHRIIPIIAAHEVGRGGTVVLVQLENELDFYDCGDPPSYIRALRDMARAEGITVPLFACAGQGDLQGAWGGVEGVAPSLNLYLDPRQPGLESGILPYVEHLGGMGYPLMVTETGRDVLLLRRLLASGAKLLGPYNQVAGYDFGFTNGVNNWGSPLSFQTSHYDFDSLVDSFGRVRDNAWEHRALAGLIETLGPALATARPCASHGVQIEIDGRPAALPALALGPDGKAGWALAVANAGERTMEVRFRRGGSVLPAGGPLVVDPGVQCFVLFDLPLAPWGLPGKIAFASAEPFEVTRGEKSVITFQAPGPAEVHYDSGTGLVVLRLPANGSKLTVATGSGEFSVRSLRRRDVMLPARASRKTRRTASVRRPALRWRAAVVEQAALFGDGAAIQPGEGLAMEHHGGLRGWALYRAAVPTQALRAAVGILIHDAADVVSVYLDDRWLGTQVPGGNHAYFDLPTRIADQAEPHTFAVRCETWGHSNFHDPRLPALAMGSLRGMSGATLVTRRDPLPIWTLDPGGRDPAVPYFSSAGGRLTGTVPARCRSTTTIPPETTAGRFHLWMERAECPTFVDVDGERLGWVDRYHPILSLRSTGSRAFRVGLEPQKWYAGESVGRATLLRGLDAGLWSIATLDADRMVAAAGRTRSDARPARLPIRVPAGGLLWLHGGLAEGAPRVCRTLTLAGRGVKATVLFNGHLVGRLFLETPIRPRMAGGCDNLAYLPSCWNRRGGSELSVLIEGVGPGAGRLESILAETVS